MRTPNAFKFIVILLLNALSFMTYGAWHTLEFESTSVEIYLPQKIENSKTNSKARFSLMINLHGCAQKAQHLKESGNWEAAAEKYNTIVAIPSVPDGGVYAGCWDYYGLNHKRDNRNSGFILSLVDKLKSSYPIASKSVFLSGLSSGGGQTLVLSCLAPDIFAGIGINAAPSLGTSALDVGNVATSVDSMIKDCKSLANNNDKYLKSLVVSVIYGDNDYIVDRDYNTLNAQVFAKMIETDSKESIKMSELPGSNTEGTGSLFLKKGKPLVSLIENKGIGHSWPAGQGGDKGDFIGRDSVNYPMYLLDFLITNNQRL